MRVPATCTVIELPPAVAAHFADKHVKLIDYDPAITTVRFELIGAPGSCVSFHCGHLLAPRGS